MKRPDEVAKSIDYLRHVLVFYVTLTQFLSGLYESTREYEIGK